MIPQVDSMTDGVFERRGRRAVRENQAEPSLLPSNQGARLIGQASIGPCPDLACLRFSTRPVSPNAVLLSLLFEPITGEPLLDGLGGSSVTDELVGRPLRTMPSAIARAVAS